MDTFLIIYTRRNGLPFYYNVVVDQPWMQSRLYLCDEKFSNTLHKDHQDYELVTEWLPLYLEAHQADQIATRERYPVRPHSKLVVIITGEVNPDRYSSYYASE